MTTDMTGDGPKYSRFPLGNPISAIVILVALTMIGVPIWIAVSQMSDSWLTLAICTVMVALGTYILLYSHKKHDVEKTEWGMYTFLGIPIPDVVVGPGLVYVAPILGFNTITVVGKKVDKDFPQEKIQSSDKIPLSGKASVSFMPNPYDLVDYINVGGEEGVIKQIDDIISRNLTTICRGGTVGGRVFPGYKEEDIQFNLNEIGDELKAMIVARCTAGALGVRIKNCQVFLVGPDEIAKARMSRIIQKAEAEGATEVSGAIQKAADERLRWMKANLAPGEEPPTARDAANQVQGEALMSEGDMKAIVGSSVNGLFVNADGGWLLGGKNKKKGKT